jgi:hypothetical protein
VVRSLFQEQGTQQDMFAEALPVDVDQLHRDWDRAAERERESRTRFAQHAIKPEEVAQELYESDVVLGSAQTVADFVLAACARLGSTPKPQRSASPREEATQYLIPLDQLPPVVRERVAPVFTTRRGKAAEAALIGFAPPLPEGTQLVGRLHPLTEALAEHLVDLAMEGAGSLIASRTGVLRSVDVARRTTLLLLRLRLLIETPGRGAPTLAEELIVAGYEGRPGSLQWLDEATARRLLETAERAGNLAEATLDDVLGQAIGWLPELEGDLNAIAGARAVALHESHRRVRQATRTGRVSVRPNLPLDVLGVYVLLPVPKGIAR